MADSSAWFRSGLNIACRRNRTIVSGKEDKLGVPVPPVEQTAMQKDNVRASTRCVVGKPDAWNINKGAITGDGVRQHFFSHSSPHQETGVNLRSNFPL